MTLTKDDIRQIGEVVVEVTSPMFESLGERMDKLEVRMDGLEVRMDGLEVRMDKLEFRMDSLENSMSNLEQELSDFKSEVRTRFSTLEERINHMVAKNQNIFDNIDEDIRFIYQLIEKHEKGSAAEKEFAKETIIEHLPAIYKAVILVAKDLKVPLPKPETIK